MSISIRHKDTFGVELQAMKLLILLIIFSSSSFAYTISGNTRTASSYIEKLANRCQEEGKKSELEQCLLNSKLFSEVAVSDQNGEISISVKERWTLIPVPMFSGGGEKTRYGAMLLETNAFGRGKLLVAGGNIGDDGHMAVLMYKDRSVNLSNWSLQVLGSLFKQDQYSYREKEKLYGYHQNRSSIFAGTGYQFTKDLSFTINFGYGKGEFRALRNLGVLEDFETTFIIQKLEYKGGRFKFYFEEGINFVLQTMEQLSRSDGDKNYHEASLKLDWQKAVYGEQAFQLGILAGVSNAYGVRDSLEVGQNRGFRGTEQSSLWLKNFVATSVDYQIPLYHAPFGTWTFAPFVDLTFFESVVDLQMDHYFCTYGVATYLFLKEIAIPGIGIELGYNSKFRGGFFSFTVGFGF